MTVFTGHTGNAGHFLQPTASAIGHSTMPFSKRSTQLAYALSRVEPKRAHALTRGIADVRDAARDSVPVQQRVLARLRCRRRCPMTKRQDRDAIYVKRQFDTEIIVLCVRWYITYRLSYRDLVAMMAERGVIISHTTIMRLVIRYVPEFEKRWNRFARSIGSSWRVDETYISIKGRWHYLYRAHVAADLPALGRQNQPLGFDKLRASGQFKLRTWLQYLGQLYAFLPLWPDPHHTGVTLQRRQRLSHISPIHFLLDG